MVRHSIIVFACALALAGCDRSPGPSNAIVMDTIAPAAPPADITIASEGSAGAQQFSYTHRWALVMAREAISPRFTRARDLCLRDKTLGCRLVTANLTTSGEETGYVAATLNVQLPHAKLDTFERALMAPVGSEKTGDVTMLSRLSQAQSVETAVGDTTRKVAQLTAYRDRLADVAKRPNMSVDDTIKLEAERARVQTELDDATGQLRTLTDGIAREDLTITLGERAQQVGPFAGFSSSAMTTLSANAFSALLFAIGALPWVPLVVLACWLIALMWRRFLQRRAVRVVPTPR